MALGRRTLSRDAFIAVNRFGLGARPGELAAAAHDPRGWVLAQLAGTPPLPRRLADLPAARDSMKALLLARDKGGDGGAAKLIRKEFVGLYAREAAARTRAQIEGDTPAVERLVAFWSNHFTVSVAKPLLFGLAGAFEREAIRPHILGRFADLLRAAMRHQAMLAYLDNLQSFGPNSPLGRRRERGLNENLARELLELHTLGVDGGYTQADVTELAKILTGWTVRPARLGDPGDFLFVEAVHEPGTKTLLGERYAEDGIGEGERALQRLAAHPATARHIATKLARHFVADAPQAALVDRLAETFRRTDGDLAAVSRALVDSPEPWAEPLPKVKSANEFLVSALRLAGAEVPDKRLLGSLRLLGQAPFSAPSPAGWPDTADAWATPEALLQRAEWAMAAARRIAGKCDPAMALEAALGPVADEATRAAEARAPTRAEGLATVLAGPLFQRR